MPSITMLDFRKQADKVFKRLARGESLLLTHRGKPVARLEPVLAESGKVPEDDPVFHIEDYAFDGHGKSLSNQDIDRLVYGR
jgi:antitoxin (DNA-binding transcriptional repressor) of toxin-antitoxin stability system